MVFNETETMLMSYSILEHISSVLVQMMTANFAIETLRQCYTVHFFLQLVLHRRGETSSTKR